MSETVKLQPSKCTITVLGAWNVAIFTQAWVSKTLPGQAAMTEIALTDAGLALKFSTDAVVLELLPGRIQLSPATKDDAELTAQPHVAFSAMEAVAKAILNELPVTPVRAFGVNFGLLFTERLRKDFLAVPESSEVAAAGFEVESVIAQRVLRLPGDDSRLNLKITGLGQSTLVDANYHRTAGRPEQVIARLDMNSDFDALRRLIGLAYISEVPQ